jgi:peptide methionine sulfoxide reductase MsrB
MNQYHARMGWPPYVSDFPDEDMRTYADKGWE